jgi:hypothetical protein
VASLPLIKACGPKSLPVRDGEDPILHTQEQHHPIVTGRVADAPVPPQPRRRLVRLLLGIVPRGEVQLGRDRNRHLCALACCQKGKDKGLCAAGLLLGVSPWEDAPCVCWGSSPEVRFSLGVIAIATCVQSTWCQKTKE